MLRIILLLFSISLFLPLFMEHTHFMDLKVIMDSKTFREFTIFDVLKRRKAWKSPVIFASILSLSALICFILNNVDGAVLLGSVLLVVGLGMPLVYFVSFFLNIKEEEKKQKLKDGRYVYSLKLSGDDIFVKNETQEAHYYLTKAYHAYRNDDAIYLYITENKAFILPSNKKSQDELWEHIEKYMKTRTSVISSGKINMRGVGEKN